MQPYLKEKMRQRSRDAFSITDNPACHSLNESPKKFRKNGEKMRDFLFFATKTMTKVLDKK